MFDYQKWKAWLRKKGEELEATGLVTSFRARPDDFHTPKMILEIMGRHAGGMFECWSRGDTDYTVFLLGGERPEMMANRWGLMIEDQTFVPTFDEFIASFRQHNGY